MEVGPLTRDRLTRDVWIYQRAKGHRFSSDDLVTALIASEAAPAAPRVVDLGCGIGSVLLHLAWSLPRTTLTGIEAQAVSFELLRRNVDDNRLADRVSIVHGDLRDDDALAQLGTDVALVTGTPPYFPIGTSVGALDEQRAYARIEYRGGVEVYLRAGARILARDGTMVMCGDARAEARVQAAAAREGLHVDARCEVVPRAGEPPLFAVWTLHRAPRPFTAKAMTLRDAAGAPTADAARLRAFAGL